jgi:hypothetical protein
MAIVVYDVDAWTPKRDEGVCSRVISALDLIIEEADYWNHDEDCNCWMCEKPRLY